MGLSTIERKKTKKYEVWIVQKWGKFAYVKVQANTIKEAKQIALASDIDWQEPSDNIDIVREVYEIKPQHNDYLATYGGAE